MQLGQEKAARIGGHGFTIFEFDTNTVRLEVLFERCIIRPQIALPTQDGFRGVVGAGMVTYCALALLGATTHALC